jgi:hypothetical protein
MDNEGDALHVEQKRGQSKTPKTRKKPPPHVSILLLTNTLSLISGSCDV